MTTESGQSSRSKPSDDYDDEAWAKLGLPFSPLLHPFVFVSLLMISHLYSKFLIELLLNVVVYDS